MLHVLQKLGGKFFCQAALTGSLHLLCLQKQGLETVQGGGQHLSHFEIMRVILCLFGLKLTSIVSQSLRHQLRDGDMKSCREGVIRLQFLRQLI